MTPACEAGVFTLSGFAAQFQSKDQLEGSEVDIIGVIVYGSPEELMKLKSNPHILASSVGIITKYLIFK